MEKNSAFANEEIVKRIQARYAEKTDCVMRREDIRQLVNTFFEVIIESCVKDGEVKFRHFGRFVVMDAAARNRHCGLIGKVLAIPAKKRLRFIAAKYFKTCINS